MYRTHRYMSAIIERNMTNETFSPSIIEVPQVKRRLEHHSRARKLLSNQTVAAFVMVFAAVIAIIVANSPLYFEVHEIIEAPLVVAIGNIHVGMSIEAFVNDFLMAIFFLLVGIELKFEMTVGELKNPRQAMLPMLAAVGGVVVPALIYILLNDGNTLSGWAIPIATDIAFALGVMSLLGNKISPATKVFFSTLAIADDILAILVIALAYGHAPNIAWVGASVACVLILWILNKSHVYSAKPYLLVGLILWVCMYQSGIHATLAGVVLALFLPAKSDVNLSFLSDWLQSQSNRLDEVYEGEEHILGQHHFTREAHKVEGILHRVTPPLQRVEHNISLFVNFLVLPIFAFVNAQVRLVGVDLLQVGADPVAFGGFFGAVLGKPIGIVGITALLVAIGFAKLPKNVDWIQIISVGIMGGLGFTMSILIAGLAFSDPNQVLAAKCAILLGSVVSSTLGMLFVTVASSIKKEHNET